MSLLPEIPNPYVGAFTIGLLYGSVFCTSTCLPYIASYIAGVGADFRKGIFTTIIYSAGRVVAYALIGILIGILSGGVSICPKRILLLIFSTIRFLRLRHSDNSHRLKHTLE
jgi:sulfite exporter TauE/SafE